MKEEGKPQGEGTSKKNQKGSQVRNEGALSVALQGRLCNTRGGVWWSSDFTESKNLLFLLHRVEWRLHCSGRPLSHWLTGCHLWWTGVQSHWRVTPGPLDYLEVLHYFTFLPSPHVIFFLFPLTSKTDQSPSSCSCLSRPSTFVPIICKPRCQINTIIFLKIY